MSSGQEPLESVFDPSKFVDLETGIFDNYLEFSQQISVVIATGNTDPALTFFADKISNGDERESKLYRVFALDLLHQTDNPDAVLFHAKWLAESDEAESDHLQAAVACRLVSSVYLEKGQLRDSADWLARTRTNLKTYTGSDHDNDVAAAIAPEQIKDILEFESYYFLKLAAKGKAKQVRADLIKLDKDPAIPAERHILASTLAFLESDLGNHSHSLQALKRAEGLAVEVGDFAEASIYASRRTTATLAVIGRVGVKAVLRVAEEYLEMARNSDNDPELIAKANYQIEERRKLFP